MTLVECDGASKRRSYPIIGVDREAGQRCRDFYHALSRNVKRTPEVSRLGRVVAVNDGGIRNWVSENLSHDEIAGHKTRRDMQLNAIDVEKLRWLGVT
jgi:hypothetical protein